MPQATPRRGGKKGRKYGRHARRPSRYTGALALRRAQAQRVAHDHAADGCQTCGDLDRQLAKAQAPRYGRGPRTARPSPTL